MRRGVALARSLPLNTTPTARSRERPFCALNRCGLGALLRGLSAGYLPPRELLVRLSPLGRVT